MAIPPKTITFPVGGNLVRDLSHPIHKRVPRGTFTFKVVIVGNPSVGKTSLVYRFAEGRLPGEYRPTLGVNILTKVMHFCPDLDIKWIIWDVGSQRRIEHLRKVFYKGAAAILLVFDQKDQASRDALETFWLKELVDAKVDLSKMPLIVVANKCDHIPQAGIMTSAPHALLNRDNIPVIETSALTGKNVEMLFEYLAVQCLPSCLKTPGC